MNRIIGDHGDADKQVYVENMLFATLDTFSRKVVLADKKTFILNDTVGFISKLPHDLVEAFKATLEEVLEADLLLHVVDVSHDEMDRQLAVTEKVLEEIGHGGQKTLVVYNKADRLQETPALPRPGLVISASTGAGVDELLAAITQEVFGDYEAVTLLIPYKRGDVESYLFNHYDVTILDHTEEGTLIRLEMPTIDRGRYRAYLVKDEV
jgi:GTP-binding protein HflX